MSNTEESQSGTAEGMEARFATMEKMNQTLLEMLHAQLSDKAKNSVADKEEGDIFDRMNAMKPKYYSGKADPVEYEDWIRNMEKIFDAVHV